MSENVASGNMMAESFWLLENPQFFIQFGLKATIENRNFTAWAVLAARAVGTISSILLMYLTFDSFFFHISKGKTNPK